MNILLLSPNASEVGGIQRYTTDIASAIHANQYELRHIELLYSSLFEKLRFAIASFVSVLRVKPNVIICMHINMSPLCYILSKVFRIPYIVITYGTDVWNLKHGVRAYSIKNATRIVSVSSHTKNVLQNQFPSITQKLSILPCSVDGNKFFPKEKNTTVIHKHNLGGRKIIFTLARLTSQDQHKGYEHILRTMPSIIEQIPNALYLIGGDGDYTPQIQHIIQELKLEQHIILTGLIPESSLVDYYNLADVFVMPSKQEGFGIVFLEALACGIPVVAGNSDGARDAVLEGKVGFMVNPDNQAELARIIISILNKTAPSHLLNPGYLRNTTLKYYGRDAFESNVNQLLNTTVTE